MCEFEVKEEFVVDDTEKAMWCINKIKELKNERDYYVNACKTEIERLKNEIEKAEESYNDKSNFFTFKLNEYIDREDVPSKETKTQISLKLPNGKIVRKKARFEICDKNGNTKDLKNNKDLLEFVPDEYVKLTESIDWANYKKTLTVTDDMIIDENGEIVDCLSIKEVPPSVDVKIED